MLPTFDDVMRAASTLEGITVRTPVLRNAALDHRTRASVFVKAEALQRGGAFKLRGAYNKLASLTPAERANGVVAVSSGNHAIAVALAASLFEVPATILVPEDAPPAKVDTARRLGAELVTFNRFTADRDAVTAALVTERGLPFVPPFDDPAIIAGQGTVALELLDEVGSLDVLVVPVSGGGLIAGCSLVACARASGMRLIGVEPEVMDDTRRSLAAGERVTVPVRPTIADGLTVAAPGALTWELNQHVLDRVVTVSDAQLVDAMRFTLEHLHVVGEPSGVAGIAALLTGIPDLAGTRVGVVLSGGNVSVDRIVDLLSSPQEAPGVHPA